MVKELTIRLQKKLKKVKGFDVEYNPDLEDLDNKIFGKIKYFNKQGFFEYQLSERLCREALISNVQSKNIEEDKLVKIIEANEKLLSDMGYYKLAMETQNEDVLDVLENKGYKFNSNAYKGEKILE